MSGFRFRPGERFACEWREKAPFGETLGMARDRVEWLGCDVQGCRAEISGPARRLTRQAQAAGWVHKLEKVWRDDEDGGEVWSDLCPADAASSYLRWADEYAGEYGTAPWEAALLNAAARVNADVASAPSRQEDRWRQEAEPGDVEPMTVLTATVLLLGGWLLLPYVAEIGPGAAEAARQWRWDSPERTTLPGPALERVGAAERVVLEQVRVAEKGDWRRWGECLSRVLDDRPRWRPEGLRSLNRPHRCTLRRPAALLRVQRLAPGGCVGGCRNAGAPVTVRQPSPQLATLFTRTGSHADSTGRLRRRAAPDRRVA